MSRGRTRTQHDLTCSVVLDQSGLLNSPLTVANREGFCSSGDVVMAYRLCTAVDAQPSSLAALCLALAIRMVREGSTALPLAHIAAMVPMRDEAEDSDVELASSDDTTSADASNLTDAPSSLETEVSPSSSSQRHTPAPLGDHIAIPDEAELAEALSASPLTTWGILRLDGDAIYLDRYYNDELSIATAINARELATILPVDMGVVARVAEEPLGGITLNAEQVEGVIAVGQRATTVLTGGPGMGKTQTISRIITALRSAAPREIRIALAAPTGKAAARMTESLRSSGLDDDAAVTLHRLLGPLAGTTSRFAHNAQNQLAYDLVVVDEASMVSLAMMARLLEALPHTCRLLLVGDPNQLASVEAGSVLGDLVAGLSNRHNVVTLEQEIRMTSGRVPLARAFRRGLADEVVTYLDAPDRGVTFIETQEPGPDDIPHIHEQAEALRRTALTGNAEQSLELLGRSRLLCAHRLGPFGTTRWNRLVEHELALRHPELAYQEMYVGRPILITRNDPTLGLANGDVGVIINRAGTIVAAIETASGIREISPWRLSDIETMHAMTVHKAQGSQASEVTVIVPPVGSRLLTRELLYTAVTRAQQSLTVIGTTEAVRIAVNSPVQRSSGLARRLLAPPSHQGDEPAAPHSVHLDAIPSSDA